MSDTLSLFGAYVANGQALIENPSNFFRDVSCAKLVFVRYITAKVKGVTQTCFYIAYQNPKGLSMEYFLLPLNADLQNLADFLSGLQAINSTKNTFTIYTGLVKTSNQPASYFANATTEEKKVLINDDFGAPEYLASRGQTKVSVDIFNNLSRMDFYFTGRQGYAPNYFYFANTGNDYKP